MSLGGFRAIFGAALMLSSATAFAASADDELVKRGEYLARLGDCGACHTSEGGGFMAGGLAFKTPTGTIYSTNITPDKKSGIGDYSVEQFSTAVRHGVAADGHRLYPAMPFPSFAKTTDADIEALYAYVMNGVKPVEQANRPSEMRFPFNIRFAMFFWDFAFLDKTVFAPRPDKDAAWNRGAYIVEGLAHCGTCHTPRGFGMQEKATSDDGKYFLSGSTLSPWRSLTLRNLTSESEIAEMLKTGSTQRELAFGPMTEVIHYSTQHFTDDDLHAVAHYIASLAPAGSAELPPATPVDEKVLYGSRGGLGYAQFCASCHQRDGLGADRTISALARNRSTLSNDPTSVVHLVLTGGTSSETQHSPHVFTMPSFATLADDEIAEILTFVRTSWGNQASPVTATQIKAMREELGLPQPAPKTALTPRFADLLIQPNSEQLLLGMRLMTETLNMLPKNVGDALNCTSCHLNGGTLAKASPFFGLTAQFPSYGARAGRVITVEERINGCFKRSMNGAPLRKDSKEMQAMVAYMEWMKGDARMSDKIEGRGMGKVATTLVPDPVHGEKVYQAQCAVCHGEHGEGQKRGDSKWIFPPLWGPESFNVGAGIARTYKAANFVKANMPIAHGSSFAQGQGGLSDQDVVDVAEYFTHQPRPDFAEKVNDWPKGDKPADARY